MSRWDNVESLQPKVKMSKRALYSLLAIYGAVGVMVGYSALLLTGVC